MKLVIVESPSKSKTIKKYLGKDYKVASTMGHVVDLPKSKLGVDVEKKYKPDYQVIPNKEKTISDLRKYLPRKAEEVYLALDPDREGEAIAANVAQELKLKNPNRIVFYEITRDAVREAVDNPRKIDKDLVDAQKARRILDRLVGYKLSELLWTKIWYGLSAGRVQSVATRLIVDREREIQNFKPEEFWNVKAYLADESKNEFVADLRKKNGKKYVPGKETEVKDLEKKLKKADWKILDVSVKDRTQNPNPPFTTSTLQRLANNFLGYSTKRTMQLAQQLYQGVKIGGKGQVGLITYMRTDSTNLSQKAIKAARNIVEENYGKEYVPEKDRVYKTRSRLAQEAHEAIRPAHFTLPPEKVKSHLTPQQYKLYKLIWDRMIACQMNSMTYKAILVTAEADCGEKEKYLFDANGHEVVFDGFAKVAGSSLIKQENKLKNYKELKKDNKLDCKKIETEQEFTKPKARYNEASLVKALEKYGIGRPSTYATIITTIQTRGYVKKENRYLFPTDVGMVVVDFLVKHFADIVDYEFTSEIEEDLDDIAKGDKEWVPVIDKVYLPFAKTLEKKKKEVKKEDVVILGKSKFKCPICKGPMVERLGRSGKFLSCKDFPKCKGMLGPDGKELSVDYDKKKYLPSEKCKECGGEMTLKTGRFGMFWACKDYPKCKSTSPMLLRESCPECKKPLVERKSKWGKTFIGCSGYPDCKYIKKEAKKIKEKKGN